MKRSEQWKPVPGFEERYEVSNLGRVRSYVGGLHELTLHKTGKGYLRVTLGRFGRNKRVHRLVLEAFIGPCPKGYQCDHLNAVRDDNRLENLRWVTQSDNQRNPITQERKKHQRGSRTVLCVETGETFVSIQDAARRKGLDYSSIRSVCHGERGRKHVGGLTFRFVEVAQ